MIEEKLHLGRRAKICRRNPRPLIEFGGWVRGDAGGTHAAGPTKREPTRQ
jgi:hypothetical protein